MRHSEVGDRSLELAAVVFLDPEHAVGHFFLFCFDSKIEAFGISRFDMVLITHSGEDR